MKKIYLALLIPLLSSLHTYGQFQTVGTAVQQAGNSSCYTLTPDLDGQTGAVWYTQLVDISKPFDVYGQINLGSRNNGGGDGMAFVLQQVSNNAGSGGGGLGYAGLAPSLAVEFDTHRNVEFGDPTGDHVGIQSQGFVQHNVPNNLEGPVNMIPGPFGIAIDAEDGNFHDVRISWNPGTQTMLVYFDCDLRLRYVGDIINDVFAGNPNVFWGFTASTGSSSNEHSFCLDYVSFTEELRDTTICGGEPVPLSAGTGAGNTFSWSPTTGLSNPNISNPVATPTVTTTYVLTVTDDCGNTRTDSVTITIQDPVPANAGNDVDICPDASTQLNATGGVSYLWSPATGLSDPTIANPIATPNATTTYTVTVTDSIGCIGTDEVVVTILPLPNADAGAPATICEGESVQLQASGGVQYQWTPITGLDNPNASNPTANPTSTTIYTVEVTDANGCTNTDQVTITVNPLPNISAGADVAICEGDDIQLQASGGASYSWSPTIGLNNSTIPNPTANPTVTTTYTVIGIGANGCSNQDEVTVTVNPLPNADAGDDVEICEGEETLLSASGGVDYSWTPTNGITAPNSSSTFASPTVTTTYTVTVTDAEGCINTDEVEVLVNPAPTLVVGSDDAAICEGGSTALSVSGASSYTWSPSNTLDDPTSASPIASPTTTTTYTVVGTDANSCTNNAEITIIVNPLPTVSAGDDISLCEGSEANLDASGADSYIWTPTIGLSDANIANPVVSPTNTTTYTVEGTDANGCANQDEVTVTVNSLPIADAGPTATICEGEETTLQASGGVDYSWTPATGLSNSVISNPTASPSVTTTYTVEVTDANNCSSTANVDIVVNVLPNVQASTDLAIICEGESSNLVGTGAVNYSWSPATSLDAPTSANPIATPSSTTQYTLSGTDTNGCMNTAVITITTNPLPNISAGSDLVVCLGEDIALQASGGVDYIWSPTSGLSDPTSATPNASPTSSTLYTLTGTDANGCMNTATVNVEVSEGPIIEGRGLYEVCAGESVELSVNGAELYVWSNGDTGSTINVTPTASTTYTVTPSTGGCEGTPFTVQVEVNDELPTLAAQISESSGFAPHTVSFNNLSTGAEKYFWDFKDGNTTENSSPTHTFETPGTYIVRLTGTNGAGCETFIELEPIEVFEGASIVPNVFTPNGDGINDEFAVRLGPLEQYRLIIFNRWGRKVFETTNYSEFWNGSHKGEPVGEGVYTYRLEAIRNSERIQMSGSITLLR